MSELITPAGGRYGTATTDFTDATDRLRSLYDPVAEHQGFIVYTHELPV